MMINKITFLFVLIIFNTALFSQNRVMDTTTFQHGGQVGGKIYTSGTDQLNIDSKYLTFPSILEAKKAKQLYFDPVTKRISFGDSANGTALYEPKIGIGTTSQYWRGDKTWQTLPIATDLWKWNNKTVQPLSDTTGVAIKGGFYAFPGNGDINNDGNVNSTDGIIIRRFGTQDMSATIPKGLTNADINGDGKISIADATTVRLRGSNLPTGVTDLDWQMGNYQTLTQAAPNKVQLSGTVPSPYFGGSSLPDMYDVETGGSVHVPGTYGLYLGGNPLVFDEENIISMAWSANGVLTTNVKSIEFPNLESAKKSKILYLDPITKKISYGDSANGAGLYEPIIGIGNTNQYWRGDKTWVNFPAIPAAQVQSNWNQTDNGQPSYIQNKPDIFSNPMSNPGDMIMQISSPKALSIPEQKAGMILKSTEVEFDGNQYVLPQWVNDEGAIAYGWGNHAIAGYAATSHLHTGVYEPTISTGTSGQYWSGTKSWVNFPSIPGGTVTSIATGYGLSGGTITTTGTLIADTNNLLSKTKAVMLYEPKIGVGTTAQYWRGDKTWQTIPSGTVTSVSATTPLASTGGTTPTISIIPDSLTDWRSKMNKGVVAYNWGNHAIAGYAATSHLHTGVYEPTISTGTESQYWRGDKSWVAFPSIPAAQIQSDWNQTNNALADYIKNKPTITSGTVTSVTGTAPVVSSGGATPAISMAQASSLVSGYLNTADWRNFNAKVTSVAATSPMAISGTAITGLTVYIKTDTLSDWYTKMNKGVVAYNWGNHAIAGYAATSHLHTGVYEPTISSGTSGQYWSGTKSWVTFPTIPAAQIQSDWNQTNNSLADYIKNKPTITSGTVTSVATGYGLSGGTITTTGTLIADTNNLLSKTKAVMLYEPKIGVGTTAQYWRGDKTWQTLPSGTVTSVSGTSPIASSGGATPAISIISDTLTSWRGKMNKGVVAYNWGNHATAGYAATSHLHTGVYEPTISTGTSGQYWSGTKSWVNFPTIPAAQIQSDYLQSDVQALDYIKNKYYPRIASPSNGLSVASTLSGNQLWWEFTLGTASATTTGALSSTDWNTFNNKGSGTVTSVATGYGLSGGTITTTGTLTADTTKLLSKTKAVMLYEPKIGIGTSSQYWRGDKTWQTLPSGTITSVSATTPLASSGGTTPAISIIPDSLTDWRSKMNKGVVAYNWGNHAVAGYAATSHLHTGVYEPTISTGTESQYWRGDKSWVAFPSIPAAQIQSDWDQSNSGSLDYIKNKPTIPSPQWTVNGTSIYYSGGNVGIGKAGPDAQLDIYKQVGKALRVENTGSDYAVGVTAPSNGLHIQTSVGNGTALRVIGTSGGYSATFSYGNVGVNTDAPTEALQVVGTTKTSLLNVNGYNVSVTDHVSIPQTIPAYNNYWSLVNGSTSSIYANVPGYAGIGTTNPLYKLHLYDNRTEEPTLYSEATTGIAVKGVSASGVAISGTTTAGNALNGEATTGNGFYGYSVSGFGGHISSSSGIALYAVTSTGKAGVFMGGNVGIGTTSPASVFTIGVSNATLSPLPEVHIIKDRVLIGDGNISGITYGAQRLLVDKKAAGVAAQFIIEAPNGEAATSTYQGINASAYTNANCATNLTGTNSGGSLRNRYTIIHNGTGTISKASVVTAKIANGSTGIITEGVEYRAEAPTSTGAITNLYRYMVETTPSGTGVTNHYGLFIGDLYNGTNKYSIWQAGSSDKNYFAGNIGVGVTSPLNKLHIQSTLDGVRLSGASADSLTLSTERAVRMYGNATVWDDLFFPITSLKQLGVTAKPDFDGTNMEYLFPSKDTTEYTGIVAQMPHDWKEGSSLYFHVHWIQAASTTVQWKIKYRVYNIGGTIPAWQVVTTNANAITYSSGTIHQMATFPAVTMSGNTLSCIIDIIIYRGTSDTLDADARFKQFDIHYERDKLGSNNEYSN